MYAVICGFRRTPIALIALMGYSSARVAKRSLYRMTGFERSLNYYVGKLLDTVRSKRRGCGSALLKGQ